MSISYTPAPSTTRFYVPKTLASDFSSFLDNDIPNTVMNFTLYTDWYHQFEEGYEDKIIRGELYPDSTKSRYSDTDNNLNFRGDVASGIKKGDMIVDENGVIYIFDWEVAPESNNRSTRALRCNMRTTFTRFKKEEVDDLGYEIDGEGTQEIAENLPCNAYRYDGRPEFSSISNTPGVAPNALTLVTVQFNSKTRNIRIDDEFTWGNDTYIIVDINPVGLSMDGLSGVLQLQAKKKPGGIHESI